MSLTKIFKEIGAGFADAASQFTCNHKHGLADRNFQKNRLQRGHEQWASDSHRECVMGLDVKHNNFKRNNQPQKMTFCKHHCYNCGKFVCCDHLFTGIQFNDDQNGQVCQKCLSEHDEKRATNDGGRQPHTEEVSLTEEEMKMYDWNLSLDESSEKSFEDAEDDSERKEASHDLFDEVQKKVQKKVQNQTEETNTIFGFIANEPYDLKMLDEMELDDDELERALRESLEEEQLREQQMMKELEEEEALKEQSLAEQQALQEAKKQFIPEGMELVNILGDGNCLFRCFSQRKYSTQNHHAVIRNLVVSFLKSPNIQKDYHLDTEKYKSWDDYIKEMEEDGSHGDEICIQEVSRALDMKIHVHGISEEPQVYGRSSTEAHLLYSDFMGIGHYDLLVPEEN